MPENVRSVSIGEMIVSNNPDDLLVAYGLGSCVAVCMYDPLARVGGMIHALLPSAPPGNGASGPPAKFADSGVPLLVNAMLQAGATRSQIIVQLCGGAQMLTAPGFKASMNIGERNVQSAEASLRGAGFTIQAQSVGGSAGRTVRLHVADGKVVVKTLGMGEQILTPSLSEVI